MQLNVIKQEIGLDESINKSTLEQNIDADITLPDYCADIQRILKCAVIPKVNSVNVSAGRATADANAQIKIIYVGSDGQVSCFEQNSAFSKYIELKDDSEDICVNVKARPDYVNCRAVSSRRIDVHSCVSVSFSCSRLEKQEVITGVQESYLQMKKCDTDYVSVQGLSQRNFPMSETAVIDDDKPAIKSIINSSACTIISDIKVINNKLLIKGELITDIIYCCEDEQDAFTTFEHSMPISQIIEINGINEDNRCSVDLDIISLNTDLKSDSSGENRLIDISALVSANVTATSDQRLCAAVDAYSTMGEVELECKNMCFYLHEKSFNETFLCHTQLDLSSMGVRKILAFWCSDITKSCSLDGAYFIVDGTFTAHFIYADANENKGYTEKTVDFQFKRELNDNLASFKANPNIQISAASASCSSQGEADVKVEIKISCEVYSCRDMKIISSIEPDESKSEAKKSSSIVIYFADSGESLWDIARKYKTSIEAIARENSLNEEIMEEKRMLLIPEA